MTSSTHILRDFAMAKWLAVMLLAAGLWLSTAWVSSAPSRLARRAEPQKAEAKKSEALPDSTGLLGEYKTEYLVALVALIVLGTVFNPFQ